MVLLVANTNFWTVQSQSLSTIGNFELYKSAVVVENILKNKLK